MSDVIKKFPLISPPPVINRMTDERGVLINNWALWHNELQQQTNHHTNLTNHNVLLNPDFHWSRTKGNTPTTADGEFVEKWLVKANGMTFSITPTFYVNNEYTSDSGSDRFVNIQITTVNSNEFEIYQEFPNSISNFQRKNVMVSGFARNNNAGTVKSKAVITFDTNDDGTPEFTATSRSQQLDNGGNFLMTQIKTPKIAVSNQTNRQLVKYVFYDLSAPVDIDFFYLKTEFNTISTKLYVDHIMEKVRIDNA